MSQCFTETAVVKDEGKAHEGRAAIAAWKARSTAAYSYRVDPLSIDADAGGWVVTGHLTGDFPGSPIDLRYLFTLEGDRIAALEIRP